MFSLSFLEILGWNFRNDAHAMASWTKPSCHRKAENTARSVSAIDGERARLGNSLDSIFSDLLLKGMPVENPGSGAAKFSVDLRS